MKKVDLPLKERAKKLLADLTGRDYLYFDFKHLPDHGLAEVIFDYNPAFVEHLVTLGYDTTDPDAAVQEYIVNCVAAVNGEEDEGTDDE